MIAQWPLISHAFELREVDAAAGPLVYCTLERSVPTLTRKELVVARDRDQGMVGQQLGDEPPERGIEGRAAAGRVGKERAAAGVEVAAQGVEIFLGKRQRRAAVDIDQRIVNQAGVASEEVFLVEHDIEVIGRPAQGVHQVGNGLTGDVPVAGMHQLGDPKRASLGGLDLEIMELAKRELVGGHFAAGRVVDDVLGRP